MWTQIEAFDQKSISCMPKVHLRMNEISTIHVTLDLDLAMRISIMPEVIF
jgi:hypothetical protein